GCMPSYRNNTHHTARILVAQRVVDSSCALMDILVRIIVVIMSLNIFSTMLPVSVILSVSVVFMKVLVNVSHDCQSLLLRCDRASNNPAFILSIASELIQRIKRWCLPPQRHVSCIMDHYVLNVCILLGNMSRLFLQLSLQ